MKNIFKLFAVVALGLFATSCANDLTDDLQVNGGEVEVSFTTGLPSRAISDGSQATKLYVQAYAVQDNGTTVNLKMADSAEAVVAGLKATVNLRFVQGMTYKVVFWAQAEGAYAPFFDVDGATVAMNYDTAAANDEERDAFYAVHEFTVNGPATHNVELYRPFAQLNVATNDLAEAQDLGFELKSVKVEAWAYTSLDLISGAPVGELQPVTFEAQTLATDEKLNGYDWLSFNYLLVGKEKQTLEGAVRVTIGNNFGADRVITEHNVPVQRNYRTNLLGSILTTENGFNVELKPAIDDIDGYPTAKDQLISVATNGGTLTLTEDLFMGDDKRLDITSNVVLDLGGKTLSFNRIHQRKTMVVAAGATLTIKNGTVASNGMNGGSAIENYGTVIADGVTFQGAPYDPTDLYNGVDSWWPSYAVNNLGQMVLNNSTVLSTHGGVASSGADALVTLNNTNVIMAGMAGKTSHTLYAYSGGEIIVNGGACANNDANQGSTGGTVINGNVTVNSGTITGRFDGTPVFYGGTFDVDPSKYVPTGYVVNDNGNGTWTVGKALTTANAAEVFSNLSTTAPTTIIVNEPISTTNEQLTIPAGAVVTLVLSDTNTLTGSIAKTEGHVLVNEGTLTIQGGVITSTAENGGSAVLNRGTMVVEGATIQGAPAGTTGWPSYAFNNYGTLTIKDTVVKGHHGVLALNAAGTTIVENCEFERITGLNVSSHIFYVDHPEANVIVNSGTFKYNDGYDGSLASVGAGTMTINGGNWLIESKNAYGPAVGSNGTLNINGGTFLCGLFAWGGEINVSGGTFYASKIPTTTMANYLVGGSLIVDNGNGTYTVQ